MSSSDRSARGRASDAVALLQSARAGVSLVVGWKIAVAAAVVVLPLLLLVGFFVAASSSAVGSGGEQVCRVVGGGGSEIPANYVPWLEKAAVKYELGPRGFSIVAAIHYVESNFGRSTLPGVARGTQNSAGAEGPGQFLVSSWEMYGQDADGDGVKDIYGIPDSIFGTANLSMPMGRRKIGVGRFSITTTPSGMSKRCSKRRKNSAAGRYEAPPGPAALGESALGQIGTRSNTSPVGSNRSKSITAGVEAMVEARAPRQVPVNFVPGNEGVGLLGLGPLVACLSGYPDPGGLRSNELGATYPAGPGKAVTIWSNVDHVWLEINDRDWGTATANFAHGPAFGPQSTAGFVASHPPGTLSSACPWRLSVPADEASQSRCPRRDSG